MSAGEQPRSLRNYVDGGFVASQSGRGLDVENPSTGAILARVPLSSAAEAARAIEAADRAYQGWRHTPAPRRVQPLFALAARIRENEERIARTIAQENGKSLPDARAEVKRTVENCEVACGMPVLQQGDVLVEAAEGIDGAVLRLPRGVYAMIAPFNFPAMVPFWFLPYAIATGNSFVAKPSEQVPLTMELLAGLIDGVGLPPGVFNLVNGDAEVAGAFLEHPAVKGVSVVGSTRVARIVAEACARTGKRFQAMGGAKNHLVVMPDAPLDEAVRNMVTSCYGCAGQRCMAASAVVAVGDPTYRELCQRLVEASRRVRVADPLDPAVADEPVLMGPLISARAREFVLHMVEVGIAEGATLAYDGRDVRVRGCEGGHFVGPVVLTDVKPGMEVHRTEIFGPVVVVLRAGSLDEAIGIVNDHRYGNGASIYTRDGYSARRFKLEAQAGMIGVNVGIPAPVAALPFGGTRDSLLSAVKAQGRSIRDFFVEEKIVTERYGPGS